MPMWCATRLAPSSSPCATAGETAVTARARSPSVRWAIAATTELSTPPENATTALPSAATRASSAPKGSDPLGLGMGCGEGLRPDRLDGGVGDAGGALAVGVLGGEVDHAAVEAADLDAHGLARDLDGPRLALELDPVEV